MVYLIDERIEMLGQGRRVESFRCTLLKPRDLGTD